MLPSFSNEFNWPRCLLEIWDRWDICKEVLQIDSMKTKHKTSEELAFQWLIASITTALKLTTLTRRIFFWKYSVTLKLLRRHQKSQCRIICRPDFFGQNLDFGMTIQTCISESFLIFMFSLKCNFELCSRNDVVNLPADTGPVFVGPEFRMFASGHWYLIPETRSEFLEGICFG